MPVSDPVDARLLAALADVGKVAVHELAARVGMDPREVAYRLVGLSATGLPLLVGVESDPNGLRAALAGAPAWTGPQPQPQPPAQPRPGQAHGAPSGPYPVHAPPSGPHPAQSAPPGAVPQAPQAPHTAQPPPAADPVLSTWGPPQSAAWARGDQPHSPGPAAPSPGGRPGDVLETRGLEGERLAIQLLEVQDPADFLFGAAGYRLDRGERAVVVHTEVTNRGTVPFASLPDNYLELLTADGGVVAKAPVSLTSRPPHKIGVAPGETAGGHTVYVVPESARITAVRWSPRPEPDERSLTWTLE